MRSGTHLATQPGGTFMAPVDATDALGSLVALGRELSAAGSFRETATRVLDALDPTLGARRAIVAVLDGDQGLVVEAVHGLSLGDVKPSPGAGVAGRVLESGQPAVVPAVRHDALALAELRDPADWAARPWCLICLPLVASGRAVGVLSAYFVRSSDFDTDTCSHLLAVAASLLSRALAAPTPEPVAPLATDPQAGHAEMVGRARVMRLVHEQIAQVSRTSATALIRGESGTGKELVAHAIHHGSQRRARPFVKVNCAALSETLIESELFGHERGAFTGAHARKKGRFELAEGGTLFLDEIGELSPVTQAKLLRVLQFREFERLGGTETLHADVRIVAATNKDIEAAVAAGTFREDLYYRVNVFTIHLPPLRERAEDIPTLAQHFLSRYAAGHRKKVTRISSAAMDALSTYAWPGNVRELENVIERAVVMCRGPSLTEGDLPAALRASAPRGASARRTLTEAVEEVERRLISEALRETRGNCARAARLLGSTERIIRYKAAKLGMDPGGFRA